MPDGINQAPIALIYTSCQARILCWVLHQKKVTARALWEVDQKQNIMKAYPDPKNETAQKNQKMENAQDIISRSVLNQLLTVCSDVDIIFINYEQFKKPCTADGEHRGCSIDH
ncbi:hypothetical protein DHD08_11995 [Arenibacter sp. H213]|nr:hypothetical protein [Arenibacter sp. H213]